MDVHFDSTIGHPTFDYNHELHGEISNHELPNSFFDHFIQMAHEYSLPDDTVISAMHGACDFLHINDMAVVHDDSTCVYPNDPTTLNDDILGFSREQMMEMGIHDAQSLSLICTHEAAHCLLQYLSCTHQLSNWQEELTCDAFMGVRAAIEGISTSSVERSLGDGTDSPTHPNGSLRLRYIEIGKQIGEDLSTHNLPATAENILARLNDYLENDASLIYKQEAIVNEVMKP